MDNQILNIVIPMAGHGSRFKEEGFSMPKPLIPVGGKAMVQLVIDNLRPLRQHRFIFICLAEHLAQHGLEQSLRTWAPGCVIIAIDEVTQGAASTVLLARQYISCDSPLLIANCDQWIDADINAFLDTAVQQSLDGLIMTMKANDPKWSFVRFESCGQIASVEEKQVVSDEATVGIYYFKTGRDFIWAADQMIRQDKKVNQEFYVAPVYNELLAKRLRIGIFNIGSVGQGMYGLGTPADLRDFSRLQPSD